MNTKIHVLTFRLPYTFLTAIFVTYSVYLSVYSGIVCGNSLYSCWSLPFCTRPINKRGYYFYSDYLFLFHHRRSMSGNMLQLSFQQALSQHFAFTTCMFVFITLFFIGVHHRVMEPTMYVQNKLLTVVTLIGTYLFLFFRIASRCSLVLEDYNMACDDVGSVFQILANSMLLTSF